MKKQDALLIIYEMSHLLMERFGKSKYYKKFPSFDVIHSYIDEGKFGAEKIEFTDNTLGLFSIDECCIEVYLDNILDKHSLIRVLLHEYCHYLQCPTWLTRHYSNGHTYLTHPYELEADEFENKHIDEFERLLNE